LVLLAGISPSNSFGTGNTASLQVNTSKINRVASLSYTNPYFTDDGISQGFDIYKRNINTTYSGVIAPYTSDTNGAGVRYGIPIADEQSMIVGLAFENTTIGLTQLSPLRFVDYVNTFGATTNSYIGTLGWMRDSRDSALNTREGSTQSLILEGGMPIGNSLQYYKATARAQQFFPISENVTFMLNGQYGYGNGYNNKLMPFFKNYYAGGVGSVRGYNQGALGPVDATGLATGGNRMVVGSAELLFPMLGMANEKSVRASVFFDGGAVYGPILQTTLPQMLGVRYSYGVALTWLSPAGPLKISLGFPIRPQPGDNLQKFQFTLGTMF
jgi:outer membrane protein insertion porin family